MGEPDRYQGFPFLRLLEAYVLHQIGFLAEDQSRGLVAMTQQLQAAFGQGGTWYEIVAQVMELPASVPDAIRGLWRTCMLEAAAAGQTPDPIEFAQAVADEMRKDRG